MASPRKPTSIDDYLCTVPADRRAQLEDLRAKIRKVVPEAEECISYGMPAFRLPGGVVAGFLATKQGASYYPFSGTTLSTVARHVRGFTQTKSALHVPLDQPLPLTLVRRLLEARRAELGAKRTEPRGGSKRAGVRSTKPRASGSTSARRPRGVKAPGT